MIEIDQRPRHSRHHRRAADLHAGRRTAGGGRATPSCRPSIALLGQPLRPCLRDPGLAPGRPFLLRQRPSGTGALRAPSPCPTGPRPCGRTTPSSARPDAQLHPDLDQRHIEMVISKGFRPEIDSYSAFRENDRKTVTGLKAGCGHEGLQALVPCRTGHRFLRGVVGRRRGGSLATRSSSSRIAAAASAYPCPSENDDGSCPIQASPNAGSSSSPATNSAEVAFRARPAQVGCEAAVPLDATRP